MSSVYIPRALMQTAVARVAVFYLGREKKQNKKKKLFSRPKLFAQFSGALVVRSGRQSTATKANTGGLSCSKRG